MLAKGGGEADGELDGVDQRDQRGLDPAQLSAPQAGVGDDLAKGRARHRLDLKPAIAPVERKFIVVEVEAELQPPTAVIDDGEQALAAHVQRQARLIQRPVCRDLKRAADQLVDAELLRPPLTEPDGLGVEAPPPDGLGLAHAPGRDLAKPPARTAHPLIETEQLMHGRGLAEDRGAAEN